MIVMDGDGFLEPYLSFSLKAFCDGKPFSCIGGRSRSVVRSDVNEEMNWPSDGLIES